MATSKSKTKKGSTKGKPYAVNKSQRRTVTMAGKPGKGAIPPPANVSMEVLLCPSEGSLSPISAAEKISFSNVANFRPAKAKQDQAAARLTELGFRIVASSPYSLSVEGSPSLFTKTFGTDLEVRSIHR